MFTSAGRLAWIAAILLAALPAFAGPNDTVVLGVAGNPMFDTYTDWGYKTVPSMQEAYNKINELGTQYTRIIVLKNAKTVDSVTTVSAWTVPAEAVPADLISIQGASFTEPYEVILRPASDGGILFDLTNRGTAEKPFSLTGLAVTSSSTVVRAAGNSVVKLDRCYFYDNGSHAVSVEGTASATLVNCVFSNNDDGIRVQGNDPDNKASATVVHCTFYTNRGIALNALENSSLTVKNTLASQNAQGIVQGHASATLAVTGCNSTDNGSNNYNPADLDAADDTNHSFQVQLLDEPWRGKLGPDLNDLLTMPKGVPGSGVYTDFEGHGRNTAAPLIGADEYDADMTVGYWSECIVTTEPIGKNGAQVEIQYSGELTDLDNCLVLIPQGVDLATITDHIKVPLKGDDGYYQGRVPQLASTSNKIIDGHARFILRVSSTRVLDIGDPHIIGNAVQGHKDIIIDTIPPVVQASTFNMGSLVTWAGGATGFGAANITFGTDPFPYPLMTNAPQMLAPAGPSRSVFAPYDGIVPLTEPPTYIYNVASVSNGYSTINDSLVVTVTATFVDQDAYTYFNVENPDNIERPIAGFGGAVTASNTSATPFFTEAWISSGMPATWLLEGADSPMLSHVPVELATTSTEAGMTATWTFSVPLTDAAGNLNFERLDLTGQLLALDLAGNATADNFGPPLKIAWRSGANLRVDFRTHMYGAWPEVAWSVNESGLGIDRSNFDNPRPLYCYRIWVSNSYGQNNADPLYVPLTGWSGWTPNTVLSSNFFEQNFYNSGITDRWLLVAMAGCDEAGNVTPWDGYTWDGGSWNNLNPSLILNGDESLTLVYPDATSGRNWFRFYVPGQASQIDTALFANLYYLKDDGSDRHDLGPVSVASFPQPGYSLFAEFSARILVNDPSLWNASPYVFASVEQDGRLVDGYNTLPLYPVVAQDTVHFKLAPPNVQYLGSPGRAVNYLVRAASYVDGGPLDSTPAMFGFKVVPGSVQEYLRSAGGEQPVRQFETR